MVCPLGFLLPHIQPVHENSLAAHGELKSEGKLSKRELVIFAEFEDWGASYTDREIMNRCGFSDMNAVRPRITELIKAGKLLECGHIRCPVTGKRVRLVRLAPIQRKLFN